MIRLVAFDLAPAEVAAVGDSWRDVPMLEVAGQRFYVGRTRPPGLDAVHLPDGDIHEIARLVAGGGR